MRHPRRIAMIVLTAAGAAGVFSGGACSKQRVVEDTAVLAARFDADRERWRVTMIDRTQALVERCAREMDLYEQGQGPEPVLDVLALSGGGDYGAFSAGLLAGWSTITDPRHALPEFDAVSGVSTGALIAPFAYLGSAASGVDAQGRRPDLDLIENLYRNPKSDWVRLRDWFFFLPGRESFLVIDGLRRDVQAAVDQEFVQRLADEANTGRILLISATNLDLGRQHLWFVGAEAIEAAARNTPDRISDIMLASAAIPGAFPAVEIDGYLFGDGGVTANVLVRLERRNPESFYDLWVHKYPGRRLPRVRYWVVINNTIHQKPKTIQPNWNEAVGVAVSTAIRAATLAQVQLLTTTADYMNVHDGVRIEVRMIAIPDEWTAPVDGQFQRETMASLADMGRRLGANPASWRLLTVPLEDVTPDK